MDLGANITSVIISLVTAVSTIITVCIQCKKNNDAIEKTAKDTKTMMEVNDYKTYLLLLLSSYPQKADEIYSVAKHYFKDLDGDSFIVPLVDDWLDSRFDAPPEWFEEAKKKHSY